MRGLAILAAGALLLALLLGGSAPFGRIALALHLPGLAVPFFSDPGWRGVARYRAGDMPGAAREFAAAGAAFNLGNAEALQGRYAAALEAYDRARATGDAAAQANFDLVMALYAGSAIDPASIGRFPERDEGPEAASFVARGDARASGTGDEVTNSDPLPGLAELESRGRLGVRRVFDDSFVLADERWLTQLSDVPGEFLATRIAHERKRRAALEGRR